MAGVWKRDGTVAVTSGSKKVTGTGTTFADAKNGVAKGHLFCMTTGTTVDLYEVDYVVSNTELHLVQAFRGTTGTGKAYEIITTFSDSIPEFARKLNASLSYYQSQSDMVQQLFTSDAAEITVTAPDGTTHKLIPWKRVTSEGESQAARAKVEADRSKTEADRSGTEADRAAGIVAQAALPLPDVWAPLSDSLRLITGYGRDVLVGSDVVARMVNFSRNSTATYVGKDGQRKTAAANEPRFEKEGLLLEGQSTNLIPTSSTLTTQTLLVQAGTHTLSFYGTGTVSLSGAATGATSGTDANNRVTLTFTATAGNLTLTVTGACTNGQLEALPFATSYIPTNGAAATRAPDLCWIPVENGGLPGMDNEKTMSLTSYTLGIGGPFNFILATPWGCIDYTDTHERVSGSMPELNMNTPVALKASVRKVARFTKGGGCAAIFGDIQKTGPTADWSLGTSRIMIGSMNESGANPHFGHVKDLKIWLKPLSDAQMKAIA